MSTPVTEPVTAVVPEVKDAPTNAVTAVDEHTPETPTPKPDEHDGLKELRETVGDMATAIATLTTTVAGLATAAVPKDVSPTKQPWTHYGSHKDDE